jgi:hypothetical protein
MAGPEAASRGASSAGSSVWITVTPGVMRRTREAGGRRLVHHQDDLLGAAQQLPQGSHLQVLPFHLHHQGRGPALLRPVPAIRRKRGQWILHPFRLRDARKGRLHHPGGTEGPPRPGQPLHDGPPEVTIQLAPCTEQVVPGLPQFHKGIVRLAGCGPASPDRGSPSRRRRRPGDPYRCGRRRRGPAPGPASPWDPCRRRPTRAPGSPSPPPPT